MKNKLQDKLEGSMTAFGSEQPWKDRIDWEAFMAGQDMEWVVKPMSWDEGAFIGNGLLGAMIYGEENGKKRNVIRFVLGRTDVTAVRPKGFPPRVPIGELDLELEGMTYHPTQFRVDLWNAEFRAWIATTKGEVEVRAFAHAAEPVITVELKTSEGERQAKLVWYAYPDVDPVLKNADTYNLNQYIPQTTVSCEEREGVSIGVQSYELGGGCTTAWRSVQVSEERSLLHVTVLNGCSPDESTDAVTIVNKACGTPYDEWQAQHRTWWHSYYKQSFVSLPDKRLESFYWIQMYKLASATRAEHLIIDNQGPWLAPTPWAGVWFNMNVQMSYSPVYASNRLELGESLCCGLDRQFEQLVGNVPEPYRYDSAGLGRSCSYDLKAGVTGNHDEVGNLTWTLHSYWRQYRYSMDDAMLRDRLFPLLKRSVNLYLHLLEEGEDGRLHLPPTISPEYGSFKKLTFADCHYDLALLRWGCTTLLASCERLGLEDPLIPKWREVLERLVPFPVDETGFMLGKDGPLTFGHRHFSHLLAVFPLHLIKGEKPEERELIVRSLHHWLSLEGDLRGFSMTGAASIAASVGLGDEALSCLQALMHIIKPNTMYKEAGPVIETPLAGAEAVHDLLLHSWGDAIHVFPAVPSGWKDVVFHELRAEGAFLVSGVLKGGAVQLVRVKSLAGEPCRIKADFAGPVRIAGSKAGKYRILPDGVLELDLAAGEEALLEPADAPLQEAEIQPVSGGNSRSGVFGGHKPWRLYGLPV